MNTGAATTVKRIVAVFELARMRREMERRRQRMDDLFATTSVVSATASPAPSTFLDSPASSATLPTPMPNTPASIDITTFDTTTTRKPLQPPPALCSTPGPTHADESTHVPASVASAPSLTSLSESSTPPMLATEEEVTYNSPIKCSTICLSHNVELLKGDFFSCAQRRYITTVSHSISADVVLQGVTTQGHDEQRLFEAENGNRSVSFFLLFSEDLQVLQSGSPWPPPIPLEFMSSNCLIGFFTATCVFDRGKSGEGSEYTLTVAFNEAESLLIAMHLLISLSVLCVPPTAKVPACKMNTQLGPVPWNSLWKCYTKWPCLNLSMVVVDFAREVQAMGFFQMKSQFNVGIEVHLQKMSEHFSIFPNIATLVVLQSCFVQCSWMQWEIPWLPSTVACRFGNGVTILQILLLQWHYCTRGVKFLLPRQTHEFLPGSKFLV